MCMNSYQNGWMTITHSPFLFIFGMFDAPESRPNEQWDRRDRLISASLSEIRRAPRNPSRSIKIIKYLHENHWTIDQNSWVLWIKIQQISTVQAQVPTKLSKEVRDVSEGATSQEKCWCDVPWRITSGCKNCSSQFLGPFLSPNLNSFLVHHASAFDRCSAWGNHHSNAGESVQHWVGLPLPPLSFTPGDTFSPAATHCLSGVVCSLDVTTRYISPRYPNITSWHLLQGAITWCRAFEGLPAVDIFHFFPGGSERGQKRKFRIIKIKMNIIFGIFTIYRSK